MDLAFGPSFLGILGFLPPLFQGVGCEGQNASLGGNAGSGGGLEPSILDAAAVFFPTFGPVVLVQPP